MHTLIHLLTLSSLGLALAACSPAAVEPEPLRSVRTMTVGNDSAGASHVFAGEVRARTESRLGFRVPGRMTAREVEVGQRVRAGQVLAQLDATDLKLGEDAAQAALRAAQSSYELAAAEFKRFKDLRDQGFISALELERRDAALRAQRSQLEQAQAQAVVQGRQAGYAQLIAVAAGVVTAVEAEPGAVLAAGTPVIRLAHDGPRDAVFSVPEDGVAAIRALQGRPGAIQVLPWASATPLPATVREVAVAADPVTRTFAVKADLGAAPLQLGQTLSVVLQAPRRDGVTRLPITALMQQQGRSAVWLLDRATMTVRVQAVAVAGADGNEVVVASGLSPGQTVVTAGVHTLTPGQKVALYAPPASAEPPAVTPVSTHKASAAAAASR